jgi:hypothetical protein
MKNHEFKTYRNWLGVLGRRVAAPDWVAVVVRSFWELSRRSRSPNQLDVDRKPQPNACKLNHDQ